MNRMILFIETVFRDITNRLKVCFVTGMVVGLLTHLYMLTNKLPNWDDLSNLSGFGSGAEYGRWLLEYLRPLLGKWSVPALNGVITIIFLSLSACIILITLDLKSYASAILLPVMVVTFPSVASTMTFMFTSSCYAIGIFMSCLGAYLIQKQKRVSLVGGILLILSLAIYQSYICLTATILVLSLMLELLRGKEVKEVLKTGVKELIALGMSILCYIIISKLLHPSLTTDRGIDTMGQIELVRIPRLIMRSYKRILEYFVIKPHSFVTPSARIFNIGVSIAFFVVSFWNLYTEKIYKNILKSIVFLGLIALIPLAAASIYIMAPDTNETTTLMLYQYFMIYVALLAVVEISYQRLHRKKAGTCICISALTLLLLVGYSNVIITNEAYFRMGVAFDRVYAYYNRIIVRVEEQVGYSYNDNIVILGEFYPEPNPLAGYSIDDYKFEDMSGIALESGLLTSGVRSDFLRTYLGIPVTKIDGEIRDALLSSREYSEMSIYPEEGSIQYLQGQWVVKVHE